jgi:hypothetical protein
MTPDDYELAIWEKEAQPEQVSLACPDGKPGCLVNHFAFRDRTELQRIRALIEEVRKLRKANEIYEEALKKISCTRVDILMNDVEPHIAISKWATVREPAEISNKAQADAKKALERLNGDA